MNISIYSVWLFRKDTVVELNQMQGQKLVMLLATSAPKFVSLTDRFGYDTMINTSAIERIEEDKLKETKIINGRPTEVRVDRELGSPENETYKKYLEFKGELSTKKLLN